MLDGGGGGRGVSGLCSVYANSAGSDVQVKRTCALSRVDQSMRNYVSADGDDIASGLPRKIALATSKIRAICSTNSDQRGNHEEPIFEETCLFQPAADINATSSTANQEPRKRSQRNPQQRKTRQRIGKRRRCRFIENMSTGSQSNWRF